MRGLRVFGSARRLGLAAVLGALCWSIAAGTVAAAVPLTFDIGLDYGCVDGNSKPSKSVTLLIKDTKGNIVGKGSTTAYSDGFWEFCNFPGLVRPGWSIQAKVPSTGQTHSAIVPRLTFKSDRETDLVSGKAPANAAVEIEVYDYRDLPGAGYDVDKNLNADGTGAFSYDFSADADILGGATVYASLHVGSDHFYEYQDAPFLNVAFADSSFYGQTRPNNTVNITVDDSGVVATGTGVGRVDGWMYGDLMTAEDDPYIVSGGETISAPSLASDASFVVPVVNGSATASTDVVSGKCFASGPVEVDVHDPNYNQNGFGFGTANGSGSFAIDMTSEIDVKHGYTVDIYCWTPKGDQVSQEFIVP